MRPSIPKGLIAVAMTGVFAGYCFASPLSGTLLSLVPAGAPVVAGFKNHAGPSEHGRLLLTTRNNRLDLDDWQALTGADSNRVFEEVIEVAASNSRGALSEHMLLVAGRLDRARILHSVEENGAHSLEFLGERVLLIEPFARERGDMLDTRWFVILGNRIGILGTPWLVQQALRRHADHSVPDSILEERLSLMRPDVTCWNVLVQSAQSEKNINFAQPHSAWAELQHDADVLLLGVRFGSKVRIDFSIHAPAERGTEFFAKKAAFFTDALTAGPEAESVSREAGEHRPANYSVESNHVQGSVELSSKQFEAWSEHLYRVRAPQVLISSQAN